MSEYKFGTIHSAARAQKDARIAEQGAENAKYQPWRASYFDMRDQRDKAEKRIAELEAQRDRAIGLAEEAQALVVRAADIADAFKAELAALKEQLAVADEMDTALEWLDNGYVVRSTDKLERLDTAQRVYRELRAARAEEGSDHAPD